MQYYYKKENGRYAKIATCPSLYADGVWLVQNNGDSKKLILKLGELTELYPFAQMMQDHDLFARWLTCMGASQIFGSLEAKFDGSGITYEFESSSDAGNRIMRFLSLSPEQQKDAIKLLEQEPHVDYEGAVRDKAGRLIYSKWSAIAIELQIVEKEKEIANLKKQLKKCSVDK